ncbi:MAG: hypothetical protein ACREGI_02410, partial [Candidatus Levyibacteriota bacterium]
AQTGRRKPPTEPPPPPPDEPELLRGSEGKAAAHSAANAARLAERQTESAQEDTFQRNFPDDTTPDAREAIEAWVAEERASGRFSGKPDADGITAYEGVKVIQSQQIGDHFAGIQLLRDDSGEITGVTILWSA